MNEQPATLPAPAPLERRPAHLKVECDQDRCPADLHADFLVEDSLTEEQRLDLIRRHARILGWWCHTGKNLTYCPDHQPQD